jgi:hypothetical protein
MQHPSRPDSYKPGPENGIKVKEERPGHSLYPTDPARSPFGVRRQATTTTAVWPRGRRCHRAYRSLGRPGSVEDVERRVIESVPSGSGAICHRRHVNAGAGMFVSTLVEGPD